MKPGPRSNDNPRRPVNGTGFVSQETYPGPPVSTTASCAKPDRPNPQSQSLSQSYGSILPTSLIYIVLSTRGCTPWRPDAVMSTTWGANKSRPRIFMDRPKRTGRDKTCPALPSIPPYRRLNRSRAGPLVKKKRELFPGLTAASSSLLALPHSIHVQVREY